MSLSECRVHAYFGPNLEPDVNPAEYTIEKYHGRNCPPEVILDTLQYLDDHHGGGEPFVRSVGVSDKQITVLREALLG